MSVRRRKYRDPKSGRTNEQWMIDVDFEHPDGRRKRVRKVSPVQTRRGAEHYEREVRQALLDGTYGTVAEVRKELPSFDEWFHGRFWRERVIGHRNKPSERASKECIYRVHLAPRFGKLRLDAIVDGAHVPDYKAQLATVVDNGQMSPKRANNILTVLSTILRYAEEEGVIARAPKVGCFKFESPEIEHWAFDEYVRILNAARAESCFMYAATCLAGEAGLRIGEIRALCWERDVDLVAGTITVTEQAGNGVTGTPKGGKRRKVSMTLTLCSALKGLNVVRQGYVVCNDDGTPLRDGQTIHAARRLCRRAGLPERGWHCLRHTYGTHAAMFGVNPYRLQAWLGHKDLKTTLKYVHIAEAHMRPLPLAVLDAQRAEADPDQRVIRMLGARSGTIAALEMEHEDVTNEVRR
ncbi:MAG: site-specific integrase [Myxococcota bacterium]|nr:site-specific integrase [Myxococcota bacterium]